MLLTSMNIKQLQRALRRKIRAVEDRQSDHVFYWMEVDGNEQKVAKFSHSSRGQLPPFIVADTAKRLSLTGPELNQLVDCQLSGETFFELWADRQVVE